LIAISRKFSHFCQLTNNRAHSEIVSNNAGDQSKVNLLSTKVTSINVLLKKLLSTDLVTSNWLELSIT